MSAGNSGDSGIYVRKNERSPVEFPSREDKISTANASSPVEFLPASENDNAAEEFIRACRNGELDKVMDLAKKKLVNLQSCTDEEHRDTPLHWASYYGHQDIVKYLVEEGNCDVECKNNFANTPLHRAAEGKQGSLEVVKYLINERGCDPMCRGQYDRTPLHHACKKGNLDVMKYLTSMKIDFQARDSKHHFSPLDLAAQYGTRDAVMHLIEERHVKTHSSKRYTPLHHAAYGDKLDIVKYLIEENHYAADVRGRWNRTPLHSACLKGRLNIVKYLIIERNVDPSCQEDNGETPLHSAATGGNELVVRFLIQSFMCDPYIRDNHGRTPSDLAKKNGHSSITAYFDEVASTYSDIRKRLVVPLHSYTKRVKSTDIELGSGAYGTVIEVSSGGGEVFAGKLFKTPLSWVRQQKFLHKVIEEIKMMMAISHEHIVQSKGVGFLEDYTLPIILMERLQSSLHDKLDEANLCLQMEQKFLILCDIASGLVYLHGYAPSIIHRDLTAKNVLLDTKQRAKIADFGNSRMVDFNLETSPETLTCLPGTITYMPPEAYGHRTKYDPSLDIFSFGHLALLTIIQKPVILLLPPTYYNSSNTLCSRTEVQRRKTFVTAAEQLLSTNHFVMVLMKQCLHNDPLQRPSTHELLQILQSKEIPLPLLGHYFSSSQVDETTLVPMSIRGAEIVEAIKVDISQDMLPDIDWEDHGLKLHIPSDALKSITSPVSMTIQASISGQYSLPPNMELVSGIYWISFPKRFSKPVTLSIQHCCHLQHPHQISALHFVTAKCTQKQLPYQFEQLSKGTFSTESCYGTIDLEHFSGLGVVQETKSRNKKYFAKMYMQKKSSNVWHVRIPVIRDLSIHKKDIRTRFEKWGKYGPYITFEIEGDELSLDISRSTSTSTGWGVIHVATSTLLRNSIDSYKQGATIHSFQLECTWEGDGHPKRLQHSVEFKGVKPVNSCIIISIHPNSFVEHQDAQASAVLIPSTHEESTLAALEQNTSTPALKSDDLDSKDIHDVYSELLPVARRWKLIGLALHLHIDELSNIEAKPNSTLEYHLLDMVTLYLSKPVAKGWQKIVEAARNPAGGKDTSLAQRIETLKVS
jgi:ankyrin repeat protein/serine/threonine protein kinase